MMTSSILSFFLVIFLTSYTTAKNVSSIKIDGSLLRHSVFYGVAVTAAEEASDSICRMHLSKIAEDLYERKKWTVKLLDASGSPTTGLHWGSSFWLGNRYQCEKTMMLKHVAVSEAIGPVNKDSVDDIPPFPVAYYAAYLKHDSDIQTITHEKNEFIITLGLCLPTSCDEIHLMALLQKYFDSNLFNHQYIYNTTYQMENVKKIDGDYSWLWNISTILTGLTLLILIILCIIGTFYDLQYYQPLFKNEYKNGNCKLTENGHSMSNMQSNGNGCKKEENGYYKSHDKKFNLPLSHKMIRCFSVYSNIKTIFNLEGSKDNIPCIHAGRFFLTLFVCLGHTSYFMKEFYDDPLMLYHNLGAFIGLLLHLTYFSVETSFCIGGYILGYSFFKKAYNKSSKDVTFTESWNLFTTNIVKRIFRLLPTYILFIGVSLVMSNWQRNNSPFLLHIPDDTNCLNYWWRNILYINNLYSRDDICMIWTWYLSNDMQYFILVNFLLILSRKYFYTAAGILVSLLFGSVIYTRNLVYSTGFIPLFDELQTHIDIFYFNPAVRICSYIIGVCAAYIVYRRKNNLILNKHISNFLWLLSFLTNVYFIVKMINYNIDFEFSIFYMTFAKVIWSSSIAWAIIACETGNGGFLNEIFSWKYFTPFTHISYVVQLVNPIVIYTIASSMEYPGHANIFYMLPLGIGCTIIIYSIAIVMTILIELPNVTLIKTVLNHKEDIKQK